MGEEIVENIFAQSNEAKTEYLHAKKAVTRMFGGGGVNLPQIGREKSLLHGNHSPSAPQDQMGLPLVSI